MNIYQSINRKYNALNVKNIALTILAIVALTISAKIQIPVYLVNISMQTLTVVLCALFLGRNIAMIAVVSYIAMGLSGIPVFNLPISGFAYIFVPSFGYILGFIPAVYISTIENNNKISQSFYVLLSFLLMLVTGTLYLSLFTGNLLSAITFGFVPFVFVELSKYAVVVSTIMFKKK